MAKKKKKVHHKRRRHSVGALNFKPDSPIVMIGTVAAGYLAGPSINQAINMLIPASMKTQVYTGKGVAVGQMGVGAWLLLSKGKKSILKTIIGGLLAGSGVKRATIVFKPGTTDTLGGYGMVPVIGGYNPPSTVNGRLNGYGQVPVVGKMGAYTPNSSLNGSKVMGSCDAGSGSGYMTSGSDYMN